MKRDLRMYILVNKDIEISKGKLCGQVGHAVNVLVYAIMNSYLYNIVESRNNWNSLDIANRELLDEYMNGEIKKIILYAPQTMLEELESIHYISIRDKGYTELEPNTLTCVNLGILDFSVVGDKTNEDYKWLRKLQLVKD
jgi:PTH2 family peptidyl-tRNA hydrolase